MIALGGIIGAGCVTGIARDWP
ncbi:hypothetical protein QCE49_23095, partial [Caballeronia sp. LZ008]|nr:hypothetical protein [Caballeronia sp. LZ008]